MKKEFLTLCLLIALAGCIPTEEQVLNLGNDVENLMTKIDEQQEQLVSGFDQVKADVIMVNNAIKAAETLPEKAAAGIEASRPFNPYADEMAAVLGLTTAIGGLFWKKSTTDTKKALAKYQAHKAGIERATIEMNAVDQARVYDEIRTARAANRV